MADRLACFTAYDIRGRVPSELNAGLARRIGRAFAGVYGVTKVVVGRDIRLSSGELTTALMEGLTEMGVDVLDLGLCGTEEIYHAAFSLEKDGIDGGVVVTASHNPKDYNGMKFVVRGAKPVTGESGLLKMKSLLEEGREPLPQGRRGTITACDNKSHYIEHLLGYVNVAELKPLTLVANAGNGCAGAIVDRLEQVLPVTFVKINHQPDGTFPKGVPNPLLPERREETAEAVRQSGADFGLAWDGDFDRCFFWDERGEFIEGYYIVGLLAQEMLKGAPGSRILYDARLTWNSEEIITAAGGEPIITRTGHAFIKERMRREDAVYGGEMSAHHYFRDFGYCDSGMIPWLLIASLVSRTGRRLSELVAERVAAFPVSGEINSTVADADAVIAEVEKRFADGEKSEVDGFSAAFPDWRFNIRKSNTEPLLRLNVESRGDRALMERKTAELLAIIRG
ncbi:phosphomannomutase [Desulforhopalus vacuolatus]|uniref:phosphomannomutase n=1 Tax=Desulforhopalus vacuolatus TaxID=40414 RepID=UPI0019628CDA|nr:phosphomannomutase [Desulforhopalus vacuolatus]MBM9519352.1 phosphomannomutase [Desulforhopalus vacuolatus]